MISERVRDSSSSGFFQKDLGAKHRSRGAFLLAVLIAMGTPVSSLADPPLAPVSEDELANEVNDPLATLTQIQLKDIFTPAEYGTNAQPNTLQFRSVFAVRPHLFTPLEELIRPTIQVVTVPRG